MIRRLFQDINLRNNTTVDAVIRHLLQANGGVTKLFEPCCAVDNEVKQRVQNQAAVLQDHAKTNQASIVILEQDTKLIILSSWLALKALCLSQESLPLCEDDVELLCNAYNIKLMFVVDQKIKCSRNGCHFIRTVRKQPSTFTLLQLNATFVRGHLQAYQSTRPSANAAGHHRHAECTLATTLRCPAHCMLAWDTYGLQGCAR